MADGMAALASRRVLAAMPKAAKVKPETFAPRFDVVDHYLEPAHFAVPSKDQWATRAGFVCDDAAQSGSVEVLLNRAL